MGTFGQNNLPSKLQRPSARAIQTLWGQLPDIHPTKSSLAKDKFLMGSAPTSGNIPNVDQVKPFHRDDNPFSAISIRCESLYGTVYRFRQSVLYAGID
jgi:hypothetical protein